MDKKYSPSLDMVDKQVKYGKVPKANCNKSSKDLELEMNILQFVFVFQNRMLG